MAEIKYDFKTLPQEDDVLTPIGEFPPETDGPFTFVRIKQGEYRGPTSIKYPMIVVNTKIGEESYNATYFFTRDRFKRLD